MTVRRTEPDQLDQEQSGNFRIKKNLFAAIAALEAGFARLIYKLYNLTESEIAIVEGRAG